MEDKGMAPRRHFHTFDALRFFAYLKVFLLHLPIVAFPWFNFLRAGGGIGVQFFFVLSGFLITYIICDEKKRQGQVNLRNFFTRRILRIWPLFYLMIGVAFVTPYLLDALNVSASDEGYEPNWLMSLLFLENYKMIYEHSHPNVSPLGVMWSLCIEEHFYIIWGLLLYYIRVETLPKVIGFCVLLGIISRVVFVANGLSTIDLLTNIDLFAFGAIPAYLLVQNPAKFPGRILAIPIWAKLSFTVLLITVVLVATQFAGNERPFIWLTTVLGALFSILICLTVPEHTRFKISDANLLSRLGIYTYGFYMYHTLVIKLMIVVFEKMEWGLDGAVYATVFVLVSFLVTLLFSIASYYLFERQFLKLKKYFR